MSVAEVYATHGEAVRALARRQLGDAVEADDIAAATFSLLLTIEGPHQRSTRGPEVRAFVLGVCTNLIRRFRRARARRVEVNARYGKEAPRAVDDVERTVAHRELATRLALALASLPEEQRSVLLLSALEEHSAADIARLCGIPEATARTRLFHARRKLREALEPTPHVQRRRMVVGACLVSLIALFAFGPRAVAARLAAACDAVLQAIGVDVHGRVSRRSTHSKEVPAIAAPRSPVLPATAPPAPTAAPPATALSPATAPPPSTALLPSTEHSAAGVATPTSPPTVPSLPARPRPPTVAASAARRTKPRAASDPLDADYLRAHEAQFVTRDFDAALRAWDLYLAGAHDGAFLLEARYNRAIALAQLGRVAEAAQALSPFAAGAYGDYRRRAAERLLVILGASSPTEATRAASPESTRQ
jgi:RNA polymerase sigma-70 factor (ECF subfamily)